MVAAERDLWLRQSERLLAAVEERNLTARKLEPQLRSKLALFASLFAAADPPSSGPQAHAWLLRIQGRYLLRGHNREELSEVEPEGEPDLYLQLDGDEEWKWLVAPENASLELLDQLVERAFWRWNYAQQWATWMADRVRPQRAEAALRQARSAWDNLRELECALGALKEAA